MSKYYLWCVFRLPFNNFFKALHAYSVVGWNHHENRSMLKIVKCMGDQKRFNLLPKIEQNGYRKSHKMGFRRATLDLRAQMRCHSQKGLSFVVICLPSDSKDFKLACVPWGTQIQSLACLRRLAACEMQIDHQSLTNPALPFNRVFLIFIDTTAILEKMEHMKQQGKAPYHCPLFPFNCYQGHAAISSA